MPKVYFPHLISYDPKIIFGRSPCCNLSKRYLITSVLGPIYSKKKTAGRVKFHFLVFKPFLHLLSFFFFHLWNLLAFEAQPGLSYVAGRKKNLFTSRFTIKCSRYFTKHNFNLEKGHEETGDIHTSLVWSEVETISCHQTVY